MYECRVRTDVENRERVLTSLDAALGEDDGYEMHTSVFEQRQASGTREVADVSGTDVANHVEAIVDNGDGGEAFVVHGSERVSERRIGTVNSVSLGGRLKRGRRGMT
jgi:hypothetical protein